MSILFIHKYYLVMRSIFLNKFVIIQFLLISLFIVGTQLNCLGQSQTPTINARDELSKSATKTFLSDLMNIYGFALEKMDSKIIKDKTQNLFYNYTESVDSSKTKHIFDMNAILDNENRKITFVSNHIGESKEIIKGTNRNLERLFSDFYQIKDNTKEDSKSLLEGPIELTLFNDKKNKFIRHYYNRRWRTYNRPNRLTAGFSTGYNINTGFLTPVDYSEETQVNLDNRLSNVKGLGTDAFSIAIGYSKWSHSVEFSYRNTRFGFNTIESQNIDWTTGYATNISGTGPSIYSFRCNQLGLQYRYSNYYQKVSPYFAAGLNAAWTTRKMNNIPSQEKTYFGTNLNLGLGINIHPAYCWDIHIAPITNLFLNSKQGTKINTRFASVGIEIGVRYNIPLGLKQYIIE